ncbi:hypothetical protein F2Q68_00020794 [Brassica cretica]|uniref:40S ribosomal protein S18 n=1 Tax=Brassica cretica TaxID=69181 RepID=A0A8S9FT62_BRACR|nr:hypothetical protein F2Q68_00020794 [Brassica cretica]
MDGRLCLRVTLLAKPNGILDVVLFNSMFYACLELCVEHIVYCWSCKCSFQMFWFSVNAGVLFFSCVRAGELSAAEIDNLMTIVANPKQYKIPDWFLNRQKDYKDGKYSQVVSNALDMKLRDDLERLKKIRNHRGLRHYWGLRVRGQHTKTTGRRGKTVDSRNHHTPASRQLVTCVRRPRPPSCSSRRDKAVATTAIEVRTNLHAPPKVSLSTRVKPCAAAGNCIRHRCRCAPPSPRRRPPPPESTAVHRCEVPASQRVFVRGYRDVCTSDTAGGCAGLELPPTTSIHNVFHVSQLKICPNPPASAPTLPQYLNDVVEKEDSSPKSETGDITADYVYLVKPFTLKRRDEAKKDIVSGSESGLIVMLSIMLKIDGVFIFPRFRVLLVFIVF